MHCILVCVFPLNLLFWMEIRQELRSPYAGLRETLQRSSKFTFMCFAQPPTNTNQTSNFFKQKDSHKESIPVKWPSEVKWPRPQLKFLTERKVTSNPVGYIERGKPNVMINWEWIGKFVTEKFFGYLLIDLNHWNLLKRIIHVFFSFLWPYMYWVIYYF